MTKTKVVDLDELYNFVVAHFSFEIILLCQNSIRIYQILKLKFIITETNSDEEMTKIKVVDLDDLYDFYIHDFFC